MIILLLTHIAIALLSLAVAARGLVRPTTSTLKQSYAGIAATIGTGTILVIMSPGDLLKSCMTGLGYLVIMTVATAFARYRLAAQRTK